MKSVVEVIINSDESSDIRTVSIGLNTIVVTMFPVYCLSKYLKGESAGNPGLYMLYNEVSNSEQSLYIGEAENIGVRLKQHEKSLGKNFWTHTIVFQETSGRLNKAHYKNLEYRTYKLALDSKRTYVINKVVPTKSTVSKADECLIEEYLENLRKILVTFNYKFLEPKIIGAFEEDLDVYYLHYHGALGKLRVKNENEMILLKDSTCVYESESSLPESFSKLLDMRKEMINKGDVSLIEDANLLKVNKDILFDSENEACAFVTLRNDIDGYYAWENINGYKIYQHKK